MAKKQKKYSPEFREYATKMVMLDDRKLSEVSHQLDIPYGTLKKWVGAERKKQQQEVTENQRLTTSEYKDLIEKERQRIRDLQEENEILKKAMHIFKQEN